uniref:NADH-ubiquinone oxidoreductase chain 6 n=1 Tax=Lumbricus terrestris TaxID=6398 RepID=NU6M_LUMTE|nr:NADH dehydrogenase subunit 6 [Lumbricus terrestris]Q34944.1 RecName: Full=NADH-ubiquinone oxidoreductase chain 6; AltName: Full=NADH dehydrogenase subunit 6 [Lumbricus terrestris]AAC46868.1 NADH dehydrogenase subunit 6 [Lumbricus terrestris]prf//2122275E NADH dehydrogenase:SUBUNIT=6 [Lumbricus terrestris]
MILTSFMLMMIATTFTLYLASTPIVLGVNILMMALLLASTFASFMSSWFAFLIFLIYIGGMLVMFAYFLALTPNQQISNFNIMPYALITLLTFSALTYTTNIKIPTFSDISQGNSILYMSSTAPFLILLALILLLTMVIVVKLTSRSSGPLRPFSP